MILQKYILLTDDYFLLDNRCQLNSINKQRADQFFINILTLNKTSVKSICFVDMAADERAGERERAAGAHAGAGGARAGRALPGLATRLVPERSRSPRRGRHDQLGARERAQGAQAQALTALRCT